MNGHYHWEMFVVDKNFLKDIIVPKDIVVQ
jgi:hypothetical protein